MIQQKHRTSRLRFFLCSEPQAQPVKIQACYSPFPDLTRSPRLTAMNVLVLGGYGNFGTRICKAWRGTRKSTC